MSAATDWANKRKAQMQRAEQLRAQRKAGITNEETPSFQPNVQGRPKYLEEQHSYKPTVSKRVQGQNGSNANNSNRNANVDSLDNLQQGQGQDLFEQPLPGNRGAKATHQSMHGHGDRHGESPNRNPNPNPNLSPGQDALGRELKRHGSEGDVYERDYDEGDDGGRSPIVDGGYKSKFMQQYESPVPTQRKGKSNVQRNLYVRCGVYASKYTALSSSDQGGGICNITSCVFLFFPVDHRTSLSC